MGGILGLADLVLVSGESVSMVSEAASSGKRTIVFPVASSAAAKDKKYTQLCEALARQGHIIYTSVKGVAPAIDSAVRNKIVTKPLQDNAVILDAVRKIIR
jgi:mitochondrial fission protein ELM1